MKQLLVERQQPTIKVLMLGTGFSIQGGITSVEKLILNHQTPANIQVRHLPTIVQGSAGDNIVVYIRTIQNLLWAIFQSEVDILHIHFAERGSTLRKLLPIAIGLLFGKSVILHAHGATYQEFYAGLPTIAQQVVGFLFSRATKIIVLSKSWQKYYSTQFSLTDSQAVVLYNPVEVPSQIPDRRGRKQLKFVFLGRIGKRGGALDIAKSLISFPKQDKGAFDLIEAFAALPAIDRQHVELVLAGNGDLAAADELITKLELTAKITVLDWLSAQQRDELLAAADAFILPSYHEGLPMSMLESMAWGLPVIVTPVGGIPEVIVDGQNGLLVAPGNKSQLVNAMQALIRDENVRISLGMNAHKSVEHLDIHHYMKSLLHLYTSVIAESSNLERKIQSNEIA